MTKSQIDDSVESVEETNNETTDEMEEPANELTGSIDDSVGNMTDEVDNTITETTDEVDEVTNESINQTIDAVNETGEITTNSLEGVVSETTDFADETVNQTTILSSSTVNTTAETLDRTLNGTLSTIDPTTENVGLGAEETRITDGQYDTVIINTTSRENSSVVSSSDETKSNNSSTDSDSTEPRTVFTLYLLGVIASHSFAGGTSSNLVVNSSLLSPSIRTTAINSFSRRVDPPWKYFASLIRYSRHDDSDPLEHEHRQDIYTGIIENPGIYLSALEDMNEISLSVLRYHLRVLETENLIKTVKIRGKRRFYPIDEDDTDLIAALSDPATKRVLTELEKWGSARNDELADTLDCSSSTISHHLTSLEEKGLVIREREGRVVVNRLSSAVLQTLDSDEQKNTTSRELSKEADEN